MTVLYTNTFTGSNGSAPSDFTLSEAGGGAGTRDIQSNKFRMLTSTTAGNTQRAILPSGNWNKADGKVTAYFTTVATVGNIVPEIYARTSGDWSAEIDTPTTGYKLIWINGTGLRLYERHGGTTTQIGSTFSFSVSALTTYGMTLQCSGTTITGRIWDASGAEPGTWHISTTDANIAGPGQFQMALLTQDAAAREVDWDNVSLDDLTVAAGAPTVRPGRRTFA